MSTFYSDGTISVANGGTTVTGIGTAWATGLVLGGLMIAGGAAGIVLTVVSDTEITLKRPWAGPTLAGSVYDIQLENADAATAIWSNQTLAEIIAKVEAGTFLEFDATGTLAQRATYDGAAKDFVFGQTDVSPFVVFIKKSATSADWSAGTTLKGSDGTNGTNGVNGYSGTRYCYSTTTTDADPGDGKFRLNHATIASATALYIDNVDAGSVSMTAWLDSMDDSTSVSKGQIIFRSIATQTVFAVFDVTGSVVVGSGYRKLTVAYLAGSGAFTNDDFFGVQFARTGDKGLYSGSEAQKIVKSTDKVALFSSPTAHMPEARKVAPWTLINAFRDGGRFGGIEPVKSLALSTFDAGPFFTNFNGSAFSNGGQYVDNSSSYGGSGAAVPTDIQDLITAAGLTGNNARYAQTGSFFIMRVDAGTGTSSTQTGSSPARYLSHSGPTSIQNPRWVTLGYWIKCLSGKIGIQRPGAASEPSSDYLVNGVIQGAAVNTLVDADGWKQVTFVRQILPNGATDNRSFSAGIGQVYSEPSSSYLIALPWMSLGLYFPEPSELPFYVPSLELRRP